MGFGERVRAAETAPGALRRRAAWVARMAVLLAMATGFGGGVSAHADVSPRVDLNQASVEELMSLPGVGAAKAQAIVEHRRTAPFRKPEELLQVRGIGDSIYAGLRDRITVSGTGEAKDAATPPSVAGAAAPGAQ